MNIRTGLYAVRLVVSKGCVTGTFIPEKTGLIGGDEPPFLPKAKARGDPKMRNPAVAWANLCGETIAHLGIPVPSHFLLVVLGPGAAAMRGFQ
jgi:hypothetical protein